MRNCAKGKTLSLLLMASFLVFHHPLILSADGVSSLTCPWVLLSECGWSHYTRSVAPLSTFWQMNSTHLRFIALTFNVISAMLELLFSFSLSPSLILSLPFHCTPFCSCASFIHQTRSFQLSQLTFHPEGFLQSGCGFLCAPLSRQISSFATGKAQK